MSYYRLSLLLFFFIVFTPQPGLAEFDDHGPRGGTVLSGDGIIVEIMPGPKIYLLDSNWMDLAPSEFKVSLVSAAGDKYSKGTRCNEEAFYFDCSTAAKSDEPRHIQVKNKSAKTLHRLPLPANL